MGWSPERREGAVVTPAPSIRPVLSSRSFRITTAQRRFDPLLRAPVWGFGTLCCGPEPPRGGRGGGKESSVQKGGAMSTQIRSTSAPPQRSVDKGCALHAVRTRYRQAGDGERYKSGEQMPALHTAPWRVQRLGIIMEPDLADPREAGGVLNPAAMRGPDGELYLLPRLVGADNCSRIGLVRVVHDRQGTPRSVTRLGVALEPEEPYERNSRTGGGVEDPRVTYVAALASYVMTYTAHGEAGPRIPLAVSHDLGRLQRLRPARFAPLHGLAFGALDNKDALLFPEPVPAPDGQLALALIHRPDLGTYRPAGQRVRAPLPGLREQRPSMWLSYAPLGALAADWQPVFRQHHLLPGPHQPPGRLKAGGRPPPPRAGGP